MFVSACTVHMKCCAEGTTIFMVEGLVRPCCKSGIREQVDCWFNKGAYEMLCPQMPNTITLMMEGAYWLYPLAPIVRVALDVLFLGA